MKKTYETPEMDVILLKSADIICSSPSGSTPDPEDNETPIA